MKEITPEVEALHREASRGGVHHRGVEKGAAVPSAGAAAIPAAAKATATVEAAIIDGSWREHAQETPKAGLWSPQWFSMMKLQHESGATVVAPSPVGYQAYEDEHLSASETIGVGRIEGIAAEDTAEPPGAIATTAAAESTVGIENKPDSVHGTPKAVPWSPHWLWDGRRTLSTTEKQPPDDNADEAISGSCDGGEGSGEGRVVLGAETARLGVTTAVALAAAAAAAEATRPSSPWKPESSAYSIMTTSGSGFQRRYVVAKPDDERLSEKLSDALGIFVAGVAGEARNPDDRTEEYDTVETTPDAENDGATARGHCEGGQRREDTAAAAASQERDEQPVAPRTEAAREIKGGELVTEVTCDTQTQASDNEHERAREGNVLKHEDEEEDEGEDERDEEDEEDEEDDEKIQDSGLHHGSTLSMRTLSAKETSRRRQRHDRSVLMALYERCRGSQWPFRDNWGSAEPLSAWYNVTVDGAGHVTQLVLSRNKLSGEIVRSMKLVHGKNLRGN